MNKLFIPPDSDSYNIEPDNSLIGTDLSGGQGRLRKDFVNASKRISVRWTLDRNEFLYFESFYDTGIVGGSQPFLIDLVTTHPVPVEHKAQFVPNTKSVPNISGFTHVVTGTLEVVPQPINEDLNRKRIAAFEADQNANILDVALIPVEALLGNVFIRVKVGETVSIPTSDYFLNPDMISLVYSADQLPTGLSISSVTGEITGTLTGSPSSGQPAIAFDTVVTAANVIGSADRTINFELVPSDYLGIGDMEIESTYQVNPHF